MNVQDLGRKEVSISEFFDKNKQMLGFDSPQKALFMTVKEAVDNSLDACGDYGILPEISIRIKEIGKEKYGVEIIDNGPGIPRKEVGNSFGKMLFGSRFFQERQTRGQQGLGISAAILYAQKTTGFPAEITTKVQGDMTAYHTALEINIRKNQPRIHSAEPIIWEVSHGLKIYLILKGRYVSGKQSVEEYVRETAIANPHATFHLILPDKEEDFPRSIEDKPQIPASVKPHPHGVELGDLIAIFREREKEELENIFADNFSRVTKQTSRNIIRKSGLSGKGVTDLQHKDFESLLKTIKESAFMEPKKDCLSPIGSEALYQSAMVSFKGYNPAYFSQPVVKGPFVYSGHPFLVEAIAVYGGDLPKEEPVKILRIANRVPLLYQAGSCALTKAVASVSWNKYGFSQPVKDQIPVGPLIIVMHIASTKVPFTSEAKEAVATVPEIMSALDVLLKGIARQIRTMKKKEAHKAQIEEKFSLIEQLLPAIADKASKILDLEPPDIRPIISKVMGVVAFREQDGELYAENYTEKRHDFEVVLRGEEEHRQKVKDLEPFEKVKLDFSKETISSSEIYVDLPEKILLGAYTLPKVFKNE